MPLWRGPRDEWQDTASRQSRAVYGYDPEIRLNETPQRRHAVGSFRHTRMLTIDYLSVILLIAPRFPLSGILAISSAERPRFDYVVIRRGGSEIREGAFHRVEGIAEHVLAVFSRPGVGRRDGFQ